jgi:Homeodomain-like domain
VEPLTPAQLQHLEATQLANIIRKLAAGKSLTKRESELLERQKKPAEVEYVQTWEELADELGRSRRTLQKWRHRFGKKCPKDKADGRKHVPSWKKFMTVNNLADEPDDDEEADTEFSKGYWDRRRARLDFERGFYAFEVEKGKHLPIDEATATVGQMLAGFRTALNTLPTSAARWLIGLRDFNAIRDKLQEAIDAVLQALGRCDYMHELTASVVAQMFPKHEQEFRDAVANAVDGVTREIGRLTLSDLFQRALPTTVEEQSPAAGKE